MELALLLLIDGADVGAKPLKERFAIASREGDELVAKSSDGGFASHGV